MSMFIIIYTEQKGKIYDKECIKPTFKTKEAAAKYVAKEYPSFYTTSQHNGYVCSNPIVNKYRSLQIVEVKL